MAKSKASRDRQAARVVRQLAASKPRPAKLAAPSMSMTTPRQPLSDRVQRLCAGISKIDPVFLPFTDFGGVAGQCHMNVLHRVHKRGGKRINGWLIWESFMFDEANFHCVWKSPDGELVDITPRVDGEEYILFLPDPDTRLIRGSNGGFIMPNNRTTSPVIPFGHTPHGMPYLDPTVEVMPNAETRAYCQQLGIDVMAVCDAP